LIVIAGLVSLFGAMMLAVAGLTILLFAAVQALAREVPDWAASMIVGGVVLLIGVILVFTSRQALSPVGMVPERTMRRSGAAATMPLAPAAGSRRRSATILCCSRPSGSQRARYWALWFRGPSRKTPGSAHPLIAQWRQRTRQLTRRSLAGHAPPTRPSRRATTRLAKRPQRGQMMDIPEPKFLGGLAHSICFDGSGMLLLRSGPECREV
jgi:hypothetical protein